MLSVNDFLKNIQMMARVSMPVERKKKLFIGQTFV